MGDLNQSINDLTADKANLESRVTILVRVLHMRDEEIAQLQQKLKVRPGLAVNPVFNLIPLVGFSACRLAWVAAPPNHARPHSGPRAKT